MTPAIDLFEIAMQQLDKAAEALWCVPWGKNGIRITPASLKALDDHAQAWRNVDTLVRLHRVLCDAEVRE